MPAADLISALSRRLLAGEPDVDGLHARAVRTLGRPWQWLHPLVGRYAAAFGGGSGVRPRHGDVVVFLRNDARTGVETSRDRIGGRPGGVALRDHGRVGMVRRSQGARQ